MSTGALNQILVEDVNLLETPEAGFCNIMIAADKTIWGRFPDGTLHQFSANSVLNIVGSLNPGGGNIDYPAADAGDIYIFISAGTIGAPPVAVEQGEMLLTITDTAGGAGAGADFTIYQINISYATQTVAGIVLLATEAKMQTDVDDEAAVTSNKLYYLLQVFGLSFILTDEVRGTSTDGTNLSINPQQNPDPSDTQPSIVMTTPGSPDVVNADDSMNGGAITITSGQAGTTVDGNGGISGTVTIATGLGQASTGSGIAGNTGNLNLKTNNAGAASGVGGTGGQAGNVIITAGWGGGSAADGSGGAGGAIQITSGLGGAGSLANAGGAGGAISITAQRGGHSIGVGGTGGAGSTVQIRAGSAGNGYIGTGFPGSVNIYAGDGGTITNGVSGSQKQGGSILLSGGAGSISNTGFPGDGGGITLSGGGARNQTVNGGAGSEGGEGGFVRLTSGPGGSGINAAGPGGTITIAVGATGSTSDAAATGVNGGPVLITAGNGGAAPGVGATGGNGGDIQLTPGTAGVGAGANGYGGTVQIQGFFAITSIEDNVAANGAGGFAAATRLTAVLTRITNVPGPNSSAKLPLTAKRIGEMFKVRNDGVNILDLFPSDGAETINGAAVLNVAAGTSVTIHRLTATELYVFD